MNPSLLLPVPLPIIFNYNGTMPNTFGSPSTLVNTFFDDPNMWNITKPLFIYQNESLNSSENFYDMM